MLGAVAVVAFALLLFAVPLGIVLRQQIVQSELDGFAGQVEQTATLLDERSRTCAELQLVLETVTAVDVEFALFDREGDTRWPLDGTVTPVPAVLSTASGGATGAALVDGDPAAAAPLSTPVCGERLVLQARTVGDALQQRVRGALLLVAGAAVVAVLAGALAASTVAAGLVRPLERLAASARRLGEGDFSERAPRAGLPEPDGIADALDVTADRLGRAVTRSRAFAADASHQLRTPVTALRLQLESAAVGLDPDTAERDAVEAALAEVDRLVGTIDELVALTQLDSVAEEVDVAALVASRVGVWQRRAAARGRDLDVVTADVPAARVRPAAVLQATDVLVDNALRHGRGRVAVRVVPPAVDGVDAALRVVVEDEGPGLPEDLDALGDRVDRGAAPVHGGRGLLLARDLVEAEGGRLVLSSSPGGTRASLLVPVTVARGADGPERAD